MVTLDDIADLLPLMLGAVDLLWAHGAIEQRDEAGLPIPKPVLHFGLPLADKAEARAFLQKHGKRVACYRLDPRDQGVLMLGFFDDGEAKALAREELGLEPAEGLFGKR